MEFQWDNGNRKHIINDHPKRNNSIEEIESLFIDPHLSPLPDRIDQYGEQRYKGVGKSNLNRVLYVAFSVRNGQIRPISCRPASREERERYGKISQTIQSEGESEESSRD